MVMKNLEVLMESTIPIQTQCDIVQALSLNGTYDPKLATMLVKKVLTQNYDNEDEEKLVMNIVRKLCQYIVDCKSSFDSTVLVR
jgi:hypothetical protein